MSLDVYQRNGHADRAAYLRGLSETFEMPLGQVQAAADLLGQEEDFDGLMWHLEEAAGWWEY